MRSCQIATVKRAGDRRFPKRPRDAALDGADVICDLRNRGRSLGPCNSKIWGAFVTSQLFTPIAIGQLELANRLVVSPMCQYSANEGSANAWHMMHLGMLANSGAGLLILEATAVEAAGRITAGCLGLYSDANEAALKPVVDACRRFGSAKIGIQLGHAGRKASSKRPWEGRTMSDPLEDGAWTTKAPSALAMGPDFQIPESMTVAEIAHLKASFMESTRRADRLGFDLIELHGAHGYLLHQFLSPLSNKRADQYGGSLANRMRLPLEIFMAVRSVWPAAKPLGMRISAIDWVEGGVTIEDSITLVNELKKLGCDFVDVSSGGIDPSARIAIGPGYQVPFAERIKRDTGMLTMAVGLITAATQAEAIVAEGKADCVAAARAFLDDPHFGWHAAYKLGASPTLPPQYARVGLKAWPPATVLHGTKA